MIHLFQYPFLTANISVASPGYRSEYPVRSADLRFAFISDSIAAFTGVSAKIALTLDFLLRDCWRNPAFGKVLMSTGLL
jgi:hypothetical protein